MSLATVETSLLLLLLPHLIFKSIAVVNATKWVARRGNDYRGLYRENPPRNDADKISLLKASGGDFFPFGSKEYQVRERYLLLIARGGPARIAGWALRIWETLYTAPGVVGATVFVIVVPELFSVAEGRSRGLALACALLATAVALLAYLEALA